MAGKRKGPGSPGLTLIEIVVVVAIIGVLVGMFILPRVLGHLDTARTNRGYDGANEIRQAMLRYWTAEGSWPDVANDTLEKLQVALQEHLAITLPTPDIIRDPAGGPFYAISADNFAIRVDLANRAGDTLCIRESGIEQVGAGPCEP